MIIIYKNMDEECINFIERAVPAHSELLINLFKEHFIYFDILLSLTHEELEKLIPQIGLRKKILIGLENFCKNSKEIEHHELPGTQTLQLRDGALEVMQESVMNSLKRKRPSTTGDSIQNSKVIKTECQLNYCNTQNTVRRYLEGNINGLKILALYEKGSFNGCIRSELAECVITSELNADLDVNKVITPRRFMELRNEIVNIFPTEAAATYYAPRQPKSVSECAKQPRGKLYDKYTTLIKGLRGAGLRHKTSESHISDDPLDITY
ncbi:uncharacterized protein LOC127282040 [Leptopilina boulardi]|uniref:uncharacterized protein LOC127282040 n=1 Tax=Leptopilina boulardi TaxID=63433 RepID=UPI0021F50B89|nr:uncharacterized protein LOC127282040 [Leptopilina boulardi]